MATVTGTNTNTNKTTNQLDVSPEAAARGIVSYGPGGAAVYGPGGPVRTVEVQNKNTGSYQNVTDAQASNLGSNYQLTNTYGGNNNGRSQITTPGSNITSSSAPVVQDEQRLSSDLNSLSNYDQQYDSSGLEAKYKNIQDTIEARRKQLDEEYQGDFMGINKSFDESRTKAEGEQVREFGTTNVALQRVGGYLGTQISAVGALNNLQATHRAEIASLEGKRAAAIQAAKTARNAEDFKLVQSLTDSVKDLDNEINKRRNEYFDNALKLVQEDRQQEQEKRAGETAKLNAANQLRDDARASLSGIINQFGGIDLANMDAKTRSYVQELADTAGIPIGSVTGKTIAQKGQENTERQRAISNSIASAGLALRQKAFNVSQQITASDARTAGLPRALVGRTESEIYKDLHSQEVPSWFVEKQYPNGLPGGITKPVQSEWNDFRQGTLENNNSLISQMLQQRSGNAQSALINSDEYYAE